MSEYKMFRVKRLGVVLVVPCARCRGEGWLFDDHECGVCSGTGEIVSDAMWMVTLAHNIAWGAALCRAFDLGEISYVYATGFGELTWRPGCNEAAP